MKQQAIYKIIGMQKDVADSGMDKQHAFDLRNIRFRNSDTNTVTAMVNECGNVIARDSNGNVTTIKGTVIGYNTLNDTGIIFTHEEVGNSYIDVVEPFIPTPIPIQRNTQQYINAFCRFYVQALGRIFMSTRSCSVTGSATTSFDIAISISKFVNCEYYTEGIGTPDEESHLDDTAVIVSAFGEHVTLIGDSNHLVNNNSLLIKTNDIIAANRENIPFTFTVRVNVEQTSEYQTLTDYISLTPEAILIEGDSQTVVIDPVDISLAVTVPPVNPGGDDEPEEDSAYSGDVICDYEEETRAEKCDHIYLITVGENDTLNVFEYFCGCLNFSAEHPIESTVCFENEKIQKVYWVDGINPLRYANIADKNKLTVVNSETQGTTEVDVAWTSNIMFESVPLLHLQEEVTVRRNTTGGVFPSSTVQWCFTYLNRYGAESNIAWISPIYYSSPDDRGGAPGETCSNSFTVEINKYEPRGRFDYIRLYHILHITKDTEVEVRRVADIAIPSKPTVEVGDELKYATIVFTDTNTTGEIVDPNELLYLGGYSVIPGTIEQKSNTMFLGNLKQAIHYLRDIITDSTDLVWGNDSQNTVGFGVASTDVPADTHSGYYCHQNQLVSNSWNITSFQRGEVYRFGFQAQDKTGRWSDVWWLGDYENTSAYPTFLDGQLATVHASYTLPGSVVSALRSNGFRKVRPVVVYPEPWERNIYTEGLLNPTVYNVKDRASNAPFAQSSWFLRPFSPINLPTITVGGSALGNFGNKDGMVFPETESFVAKWGESESLWKDSMACLAIDSPAKYDEVFSIIDLSKYGSWAEFRHNHPLGDSQQRNGEVQSMYNVRNSDSGVGTAYTLQFPYTSDTDHDRSSFVSNWSDFFYVDQSIFTMNSADIEFDNVLQAQILKDYKFRIVGIVPITSFISSYDITTNTPPNKYYTKDNNSLLIPQGFYSSEVVGARIEECGHGWKSLISGSYWHDDLAYNSFKDSETGDYNNTASTPVGFAVYPWQGTGSLNNDSIGVRRVYPSDDDKDKESKSATGDNYISAELKSKTLANLHYSYRTHSVGTLNNARPINAKAFTVLDEQGVSLTKIDNLSNSPNGTLHYFGNINKLVIPMASGFTVSTNGTDDDQDAIYTTTSSRLSRKGGYPKMASSFPYLLHQFQTDSHGHLAFISPYTPVGYPNILFGSGYLTALTYPHPNSGHPTWLPSDMKDGADRTMASIPIKYKSCNHLVVALDYEKISSSVYQKCLGWLGAASNITDDTFSSSKTPFWCSGLSGYKCVSPFSISQPFEGVELWSIANSFTAIEFDNGEDDGAEYFSGYLYMGQLYKDTVENRFGGSSDEALEQNVWLPAGDAVYLTEDTSVTLTWKAGDTYYQRYDALRTYPFAEEDVNKVVDIVSFMTETHTNIDGRYDRNRGLTNNNHCRPANFNKMNYVYSQRDNFFSYHAMNPKKVHLDVLEYSFTWTLPKVAGSLRDEWTRITLASSYDCDGNKGPLNRIVRLDNSLVAFQSGGVAQILFDESVQIQSSEGLPIELANSGKMQGLRYYTTETGCQNKWSIAVAPTGIYWVDGRNKEFYVLGESIVPIATTKSMSTWFKNSAVVSNVWDPLNWKGFITHNDITTNELLLTTGNTCLCYDTLTGEFTSFYDYQKTDALFTIKGTVITAAKDRRFNTAPGVILNDNLWLHRKSKEANCYFYNKQYPFWVEVVCNSNNQGSDYGFNKVFDNLSWRSDVWDYQGDNTWQYKPFVTYTDLSGFDNYQKFSLHFDEVNGANNNDTVPQLSRPRMPINLRKKFKVWYSTMPRAEGTVRDRIRDTWCHIRLTGNTSVSNYRHVIHDLTITYFIP